MSAVTRFWKYTTPFIVVLMALAVWSRWVAHNVEESAASVEDAALAVHGAVLAVDSIDVDSLRSEGVKLGGAVGASLRAMWDTLTADSIRGDS